MGKRPRDYKAEYKENRETKIRNALKWRRKLREQIFMIIGKQCVICGKFPKRISIHEIHGKPHSTTDFKYILAHIQDFVPMCNSCHVTLHRIFNRIEKFMIYLKKLESG
jgi:predicted HNH restriction endonuclease